MNVIDQFLDSQTAYRLALRGLIALAALSIVFAFFGWLPFTAVEVVASLIFLLFSARVSSAFFSLFTKSHATPESSYITALILFFIFAPVQSAHDGLFLMLAAFLAIASKYIFAWRAKHIFNPAAFSAFIFSLVAASSISWWILAPILLPFVLVLDLLFVRKMRSFDIFFSFVIAVVAVLGIQSFVTHSLFVPPFLTFITATPAVFFSMVLLIDPQTVPHATRNRYVYGACIGLLMPLSFAVGPLVSSPEFLLLLGNIYAFGVNAKGRINLTFHKAVQLSPTVQELYFVTHTSFAHYPGQYIELTIPHKKPDTRGIRRLFTIASAPGESFVRIGMQMPVEMSTFKNSLRTLEDGAKITATSIRGTFTLPNNPTVPIACIADGIGITPFISMFRYLAMRHERRDIVLIYAATSPRDFAYADEIESYKDSIGVRVLYLPATYTELSDWEGRSGFVSDALIREQIPDYAARTWYLSASREVVGDYAWVLKKLSIPRKYIRKQFFHS